MHVPLASRLQQRLERHLTWQDCISPTLQGSRPCHRPRAWRSHCLPTCSTQPAHSVSCPTRRQLMQAAGAGTASGLLQMYQQPALAAQGAEELSAQLEKRVHEFTLGNGLHFIVLQRRNAPIVACHTYANVGAFDEEPGLTGISHLLEHMAFKGSPRIGTRDFAREAPLLNAMDEAFYLLRDAEQAGSAQRASQLSQRLQSLQQQAAALSVSNDFGARLSQAGAVGLNASTSHDATKYFLSMPIHKLELWFALEAERFRAPVFRELYSEKQVVLEERRLRVDNSPMGAWQEAFAAAAFANNYGRPVIGYPEDVAAMGRREVQRFFNAHYGPRSLTVGVVGDVEVEQVQRLAEKYFGGWQSPAQQATQPPSDAPAASAAPPPGERRFARPSVAGPAVMQAYYRPSLNDKDAVVLEVLGDMLSGSRTSRLYRGLVQTGQAYSAQALSSFPGEKHANAVLLYGIPSEGTPVAQLEAAMLEQTGRVAADGPTDAELQRIKKATKLSLVEGLRSNSSTAGALCAYHVMTGTWHNVLDDLQTVERLTAADVQAVAARTFDPANLFTGYVLKA